MTKQLRKCVLSTAAVLALGIGGAALDNPANAGNAVDAANLPQSLLQASDNPLTVDFLRKDDIRWAQLELRDRGLYKGSLDGVLGPETKRALDQFQKTNGLGRSASLDAQTWEALTGNHEIAQGSSSAPSDPDRAGSATNAPPASDLGR